MKIHYLSHSTFPSVQPSSLQAMKMCEAFGLLGHDVVLFGFENPDEKRAEFAFYDVRRVFRTIKFPRLKVKGFGMALYARKVVLASKEAGQPDFFYGREAYSLLGCVRFAKPLFYEVHVCPQQWGKRLIERTLFRSRPFRGLVAVSTALKKLYVEGFRELSNENTLTAHNAAPEPRSVEYGKALGPEPGRVSRFQVGYVGTANETHGIDTLVLLAADNPDMDFQVLGGTPEVVRQWRENSSAANLHFHGHVLQTDLPAWYRRFDLMIAPYHPKVFNEKQRYEVSEFLIPLKLYEYMSYHKAIICSDLPAVREVFSPGTNIWLVPPDDRDEWNTALQRLREDTVLRETLASEAFKLFQKGHTWECRARKIMDFITPRMG